MKRLLDSDASSFEGALLRAVSAERPSADLELRMRAALGLDPASPEPVQPAPKAASLTASPTLPLVGLVVAGLIAGASFAHRESSAPRARDASARRGEPVAVSSPDPSPERTEAPPEEQLRPVPLDALPRAPSPATNAKAPSNDLSEEMRLIDAARSHTASGAAKKALSVLATYDRRFPRGALKQEAAVLRVEALEKSGDEKRAAEFAKKFVSEHPNSPHVERVQKLSR